MLFMLLRGRYRLFKRVLLPATLAIALLIFLPARNKDRIFFFNSGVSDCILIFADDGQSLMIDTGGISGQRAESALAMDKSGQSWLYRRLRRWMRQRGIKEIDYVMITHLHSDHAGGLADLMENVQVHNLILSEHSLQSKLWQGMQKELDLPRQGIIAIGDTCSFSLGSHRMMILHPDSCFV